MRTEQPLLREAFTIPSDTPEIGLWLRHRRNAGQEIFDAAHTIIMMHGATYSSGSLFDTPLEGKSFMDFLASAGFDVWALDVRGYGGSARPASMCEPAMANPPSIQADVASRDLATAVDYILARQQLEQINIIGMSWGGTVTGLYTTLHNEKVRRLALIAPQWLTSGKTALDPGGELGAWRDINIDSVETRWLQSVPGHKRADLIPAGGFALWARQTLAEEPNDDLRQRRHIRASTGPVQDKRDYWTAGRPVYQPADIRVPVLLLHGEWDSDVPIDLAQSWYLSATKAPWKRWTEIGEATHMMVLEKNRYQVYEEIRDFLRYPLTVG
ncbi:alpha/beta hydrolase [Serratia sp. M24T3]|uniref:alpha/beta hydrolase n=1 Tax=Serratia sp. M24T3 TaxID=932213 RepID=UPI00025BB68F|nr:alpha/beta fold hydrolase [Serratia sp. M24T3]EIC83108.1 alpha/beta hydrolase [Serratia sp. M24T3]